MSDSNQIRDYLLGRLPDAAAEDFEERLFTSDELLREVAEEQDELIDDYLAGDLSAEEERSFRAQVEKSATLAEKVEMHRRMLRALERQPAKSYEMRRLVWVGVFGAAIAVVVSGLLLPRFKPAEVKVATIAESSPTPRQNPLEAKPDAVFFLSRGVTRGTNSRPLLKIPATAKIVELEVELPVNAETLSQWQLMDLDGRMPGLVAVSEVQHVGRELYVAVKLPADALPNGDHSIRLRGVPADSPIIGRSFSVLRGASAPPTL